MITLVLEEHGLPLYSASVSAYSQNLDSVLKDLTSTHGALISVVPKTFGRATYHFAVFQGQPTVAKTTKTAKPTKSDAAE